MQQWHDHDKLCLNSLNYFLALSPIIKSHYLDFVILDMGNLFWYNKHFAYTHSTK